VQAKDISQAMSLETILRDVKEPRPKTPRPIVMIGSGGIVHDAHLPAYAKAGFPVAALVDVDREKADTLAKKFNVPLGSTSISEAISFAPADSVFDVAVPAKAIPGILVQIPDGAAVLIQKPMGDNLAEGLEILRICRSKGLVAAVNFQLRWAPNMLAARSLTESGVLGRPSRHGSFTQRTHALGAVELSEHGTQTRNHLPLHSLR
jgi:predicted dehydrogenase